ncbi:hypothetical protein BHE97_07555 [Aeromicrobium sp. PE09-221]|uniref:HNH endonuclease signature motif containing protein n=1 Tax=Aeromicrobium sp. PE09-221 TaxID=1898043 RepID=UPI000B3E627A|nr:HNH endonuclease signature motif containing protein [Aeromicrobium sp. PE09-221]OUZ10427.1 hypothetical protein BHE97_07555 [Aeromicrobium sp. PE09-221]
MVAQHIEPATPLAAELNALQTVIDRLEPLVRNVLTPTEAQQVTQVVGRVKNRLDALTLRAARVIHDSRLARRQGAASTGDLLGRDLGNDRGAGNRLLGVARDVPEQSLTDQALSAGDVTLTQARIIADGLKHLPTNTTPEQRQTAERTLIDDASLLTPKDLRARADRIADQWASPQDVDRHESGLLAEREQRAWENTKLAMWANGDGTTSGRFTIPDAQAAMLKTVLDAYASPRRVSMLGRERTDEYATRVGRGFCELIERVPTDRLPNHGGNNVLVAVNMDLADLESRLEDAAPGTITTDGTRLSPGQTRRLACDAKLLPQVFDGESVPLDLGREERLFTRHQRIAIANRDHGCASPGCDRPPGWCEAHHGDRTWAQGGTTNLKEAISVCAEHHRQIHAGHLQCRLNPHDGTPEFRQPGTTQWKRHRRWRPQREDQARGRPKKSEPGASS